MVEIYCGVYHNVAVTYLGHIFTWGKGSNGQLGHNDTKDCEIPKQVMGPLDGVFITGAAAGAAHTLALVGATGAVYAWGQGQGGALGVGHEEDVCMPTLVPALQQQEEAWRENYIVKGATNSGTDVNTDRRNSVHSKDLEPSRAATAKTGTARTDGTVDVDDTVSDASTAADAFAHKHSDSTANSARISTAVASTAHTAAPPTPSAKEQKQAPQIPSRTRQVMAGGIFSFALQERCLPGEVFDGDLD